MKMSKSWVTILLVGIIVGGFSVGKLYKEQERSARLTVLKNSARVKGTEGAPVRIIEYTDFQCPACSNANALMENMFELYKEKIFVEHKHFPLAMHPHARRASIFAECAAEQGRFWLFQDVLFKSQTSWSRMVSIDAYFSELAVSLGLDGARLLACVNSPAADMRVKKDIDDGYALQVKATPTFFVNGKMFVGGPLMVQEVESIVGKK